MVDLDIVKKDKDGWSNADIVCAIHNKGSSLRKLSLKHGLSESTLKTALHRRYRKGEKIIADFISEEAAKIWPERYPAEEDNGD